mmetsp:Transcript_36962/g.42290  ORF Transcript_36962/g.42290 Transcript_36962/m.42290 type:complete len:80 (+) Transcript_36962:340-579(+)
MSKCDEAVPLNWSSQQPMCRLSASVPDAAAMGWVSSSKRAEHAARKVDDFGGFMVSEGFCPAIDVWMWIDVSYNFEGKG